jgi:diacylglycerol kinase
MDFAQPDIAIQAGTSLLQKTGSALKKVFVSDPGLLLQLLLTFPVIAAGIILHVGALKWFLILLVTLLFLVAGIFRTAALLQIQHDPSLHRFHVSRIKCMGNALVALTACLSLLTYLLVFVPLINQMI